MSAHKPDTSIHHRTADKQEKLLKVRSNDPLGEIDEEEVPVSYRDNTTNLKIR